MTRNSNSAGPVSQEAFDTLISCMLQDDARTRFEAADAAEKASRTQPSLLVAHREMLLGAWLETGQTGMRWHLLQMLPRLELTSAERCRVFEVACQWLEDNSRIVAAEALTAMFALSLAEEEMRDHALQTARRLLASPSAALRARARKMLAL